MDLETLYTLTGKAVTEKVGKVQEGERLKIEFRGKTAQDSPIKGKAHGTTWILVGSVGPSTTNAVQEIMTPAGERLVVELRGYAHGCNGEGMEIRTCGIIRSSAASFAHLNGRIALVIQRITKDDATAVDAYQF
ncbi:MAG: hypothetical protein ACE5I7_16745 [Candidatus Binatia bacterium]